MITFLIQNETHALNFAPLAQSLLNVGVSETHIRTLHGDMIFGMDTIKLALLPNQEQIALSLSKPYYLMSTKDRFLWIYRASRTLEEYAKGTRLLVIGSDGAVQRVIANAVRKQGGRVILLLDGVLQPWSHKSYLYLYAIMKRTLQRTSAYFNLNQYFPSDIGHTNLDEIYVMNEAVRNVLLSQRVLAPIKVVTLPRFINHAQKFSKLRQQPSNNCLYVTGAYKWHGDLAGHNNQQKDITDLQQFAKSYPNWRIKVRIHPRELDLNDYQIAKWPKNMTISLSDNDPIADMAWTNLLITARSTMAIEAEMVGLPVLIYHRNFAFPEQGSYLAENQSFYKTDNLKDVLSLLQTTNPVQSITSSVEEITNSLLKHYIDCC